MSDSSIMALDVGEQRIGVAIVSRAGKLPVPLTTLTNQSNITEQITGLTKEHNVSTLVVGLPRGLDGQTTAQTAYVQKFVTMLKPRIDIPIVMQDEAVTSVKAREELEAKKKPYIKSDIDKLAATYILEDYMHSISH